MQEKNDVKQVSLLRKPLINVSVILALSLLINAMLSVHSWYPEARFWYTLIPVPESGGIFLFLLLFSYLPIILRLVFITALSSITVFLSVFSTAEGFIVCTFRRRFVPWTDIAFIHPLTEMVFADSGFPVENWILPIFLLLFFVLTLLVTAVLWILQRNMIKIPRTVMFPFIISLFIAGVFFAESPPLFFRVAQQRRPPENIDALIESRSEYLESISRTKNDREDREFFFPNIEDKDIYLFIIESYGYTLFSNERHFSLMEGFYSDLQENLSSRGYTIYSNFIDSTTFGGTSWLADATLLTGVRIQSQHAYDEIINTDVYNLTHLLDDAGYERSMIAPGTRNADQNWRDFYQFDNYVFYRDFQYNGPIFTFGYMPDQFALNYVRNRFSLRDTSNPQFFEFILVSSHAPFRFIPEYIEDWDSIDDGSMFYRTNNEEYDNNWLTGGEYPEGYTASIRYVLHTVTEFLYRFANEEALVIIVGDHQPKYPVSEGGASFSVPVHILSRTRKDVFPFSFFGYTEGIIPEQELPHTGMEEFLPQLLEVIGTEED
ncbi:MAG: sulfatase-like hydrolase/transferase [Spirochaetia bacterium]